MNDPSKNFGKCANDYAQVRPSYPDEVFETLCARIGEPRRRAVELGAGSGQATQTLAVYFEQVVAFEPDVRHMTSAYFPASVQIINQSAEQARFERNTVDAVISATAFHWMDQLAVCNAVCCWLRSGGAFFPFAYQAFEFHEGLKVIAAREQEKWAPYRDKRLDDQYDYVSVLISSGVFSEVEPYSCKYERIYSVQDAAMLLATTSFASAYARDHGGVKSYANVITKQLGEFDDEFTIGFPISGAIGIVA